MKNPRRQAGGEGQVNCPFAPCPLLCGAGPALPGSSWPAWWMLLSANSLAAIPALAVASPFSTSLTSSELNPGFTSSCPDQVAHLCSDPQGPGAVTSPYVRFSQGSELSRERMSSPISTSTSLAQASKMRAQERRWVRDLHIFSLKNKTPVVDTSILIP